MAKKSTATQTAPKPAAAVAPAQPNPYCADGCGSRVGSPKSTFLQGHDQRLISDLSTRVVTGGMGPFQRALLVLVDDPKPAEGAYTYAENDDIMDRINTVNAAITARFSDGLAAKFTSAAMAKWDKSVRRSNTEAAKAEHRAAKAAAKANRESPATKAVFRHLQASDGQPGSSEPIGASFTLDAGWSQYRTEAAAHLKDNSNLKTATIEQADWKKIHEYFASGLVVADATPAVETDTAKKTVGQPVKNLRGTAVKVKIGRWIYDATVVGMNQAGKVTAVEYTDKKGEEKTTDRFTLVD